MIAALVFDFQTKVYATLKFFFENVKLKKKTLNKHTRILLFKPINDYR